MSAVACSTTSSSPVIFISRITSGGTDIVSAHAVSGTRLNKITAPTLRIVLRYFIVNLQSIPGEKQIASTGTIKYVCYLQHVSS